jgi:3-methyl-2-oxobutanoate hydroxymethyltransferase
MSAHNHQLEKAVTLSTLLKLKSDKEKISCIALYDAAMSSIAEQSGVEIALVGDSLGMTVQGHDSTLPVTTEDMAYHIAAVKNGNNKSFIIGDMSFMSYATTAEAVKNAGLLMQAGAHMVKMEGGDWLCETVRVLSDCGVPVCAHLGLTPQSVNKIGGYRVQGRDQEQADKIMADAQALSDAGADILVLECVPSALTKKISQEVDILTIGIGAGPDSDAQVLVVNDLLGMTPRAPKFSKNFLLGKDSIQDAMSAYVSEVKDGSFPSADHSFE